MKQIQTLVWCDLCYGENETQEQATYRDNAVTLGGGRAKSLSLDLCERHYKELIEPLAAALQEYGVPAHDAGPPVLSGKKRAYKKWEATGPILCGFPGCSSGPLASPGSFGSHVRQIHGITIGEYRATYGDPVSVPAEEGSDPDLFAAEGAPAVGPTEASCEICGESWSHEKGNSRPAQARGVHMSRKHGITGKGRVRDRAK